MCLFSSNFSLPWIYRHPWRFVGVDSVSKIASYYTQNNCSLSYNQSSVLILSLLTPSHLEQLFLWWLGCSFFRAWLPLRPPQSIRNVCICLDFNYGCSSSPFPGGPQPHITKGMQLDSYLSVYKHSTAVTLNSTVHTDDLRTEGRLIPHGNISESQPGSIAAYYFIALWWDNV